MKRITTAFVARKAVRKGKRKRRGMVGQLEKREAERAVRRSKDLM